jgi:exo-beta-1,3-glucanase (GH17 family)
VKPYANNYLNAIDACGNFSILITTGGIDADVDEVIFYFVERAKISDADVASPAAMSGKYMATATVYRSSWENSPPLTSNIPPGFVPAGTEITLSCAEGDVIRYTLDGSDPVTSLTAQIYGNSVFTVPADGALLVKATVGDLHSCTSVFSLTWLPQEPLNTPFWGLNVSLALNGEPFDYPLTEEATRERMAPVAPLTKWIRTFSTMFNGHEYINQIAKESGLRTMIGVRVTDDAEKNETELEGLQKILQDGPAPDLIAVGNETNQWGISPETLASCIDAVRELVLNSGFVIPVGTVDIANISWNRSILEKLDFIGVNIYCGTWDNVSESQMLEATKQTFANTVSAFPSKLVLLTEAGTPYSGGSYSVDGGTQTPSENKAANYLCGFLDWVQADRVPSFYFEAYDEPVKSQNDRHPVEQYLGVMDGNLQIHSFYRDCITEHTPFIAVTGITGVHETATAGTPLALTGNVIPENATCQTIAWSVESAGTAGATISDGNTLHSAAAGTVVVRATIAGGIAAATDYTQDFTITVTENSPPTGAAEQPAPDLKIFPNPFTDVVRITGVDAVGSGHALTLRVINAAGASVHTQILTNPGETIRLEHLPAGIYFFRVESDRQVTTVKAIKRNFE